MASSQTEEEKKRMADKIKDMFNKRELDITVETAKRYIGVCGTFQGKGYGGKCKKLFCPELHIDKKGFLRPSLGLYMAWQCHNDPTAQPSVYVDQVLALQGFLLAAGSRLIVDRMINKEGAYVFKFAEQPIRPHVVQIARQRFVNV